MGARACTHAHMHTHTHTGMQLQLCEIVENIEFSYEILCMVGGWEMTVRT